MTITRRVEEIGDDLHDQLQSNVQKYVSVSLALDESTDRVSTAQLLIFLRGVTNDFQVLEELLALVSLKKRTEVVIYLKESAMLLIGVIWNSQKYAKFFGNKKITWKIGSKFFWYFYCWLHNRRYILYENILRLNMEINPFQAKYQTLGYCRVYVSPNKKASSPLRNAWSIK